MRRRPKRGFTLLELMLVLAILVAIAALAAPSLSGTLDGYRLRKTADLIRAEWATARNDAMETGRIHLFRYEAGGRGYWTQPWSADQSTTTTTGTSPDGGLAPSAMGTVGGQFVRQLPRDIVFVSGQAAADTRMGASSGDSSSALAADPAAAAPIVFYPDGTTSTARLMMKNEKDSYIAIEIRGLTGISQVGEIFGEGDLP